MLLVAPILAPPEYALVPYHPRSDRRRTHVRLVRRRASQSAGDEMSVRVNGHTVGTAPTGAVFGFVPCFCPGGFGVAVAGVVSGAYTKGTNLGVVVTKGRVRTFPNVVLLGVARDGSALLMSDDEPPSQAAYTADEAWLDRDGRRLPIGCADGVWPLPDGDVLGRAYKNPDGGYSNAMNLADRAVAEAFLWRNGKRASIGSWWPMCVDARGVAYGFGEDTKAFRHQDEDRTGSLVRWEEGTLRTVDLGGKAACAPLVARDDGTVVLGLAIAKEERRLAILRQERLDILPSKIGGVAVDPRRISVDDAGRIHFEDEDGHDWQVTRRAPR